MADAMSRIEPASSHGDSQGQAAAGMKEKARPKVKQIPASPDEVEEQPENDELDELEKHKLDTLA